LRSFKEGESVRVHNYGRGDKWLHGTVVDVLGSRNYLVQTGEQFWKRHVDQLLKTVELSHTQTIPSEDVIVYQLYLNYQLQLVHQKLHLVHQLPVHQQTLIASNRELTRSDRYDNPTKIQQGLTEDLQVT